MIRASVVAATSADSLAENRATSEERAMFALTLTVSRAFDYLSPTHRLEACSRDGYEGLGRYLAGPRAICDKDGGHCGARTL